MSTIFDEPGKTSDPLDAEPDLAEGHEPFGAAAPEDCSAEPVDCGVTPHVLDGEPHRAEVPMGEELLEQMAMTAQHFITSPIDGLPVPAGETSEIDEAPPFTYESFVCVADDREWLEVFHEDPGADDYRRVDANDYATRRLARPMLRMRSRFDSEGMKFAPKRFLPEQIIERHGLFYAPEDVGATAFVAVRPRRPRCEHLKTQILNVDGKHPGEIGYFAVFRNCSARRSVGGALMSLRDQAVYACEYRMPPDAESTRKHVLEPEKRRLALAGEISREPLFSPDGSVGLAPSNGSASALPEPGAKA